MYGNIKKVYLFIGLFLAFIFGLISIFENVESDSVSLREEIFNEQSTKNIGHSYLSAQKFENNKIFWDLTWEKPTTENSEALDWQLLLNKAPLAIDPNSLKVYSKINGKPMSALENTFILSRDGTTIKQRKELEKAQRLEIKFTTVVPENMQKSEYLSKIGINAHVFVKEGEQPLKNILKRKLPTINVMPLLLKYQKSSSNVIQKSTDFNRSDNNSSVGQGAQASKSSSSTLANYDEHSVATDHKKITSAVSTSVPGVKVPSSDTTYGSLVISDKDFNSASEMKKSLSITGVDASDYEVRSYEAGDAPRGSYDKTKEIEDNIYKHYLSKSGKVNVEFSPDLSAKKLAQAVVSYQYSKIGYVVNKNGEKVDIGAKVTISDMHKSDGDGWQKDGYPDQTPFIDISTNMFSGNDLAGVNSSMYDIEFIDTKTGKSIDFSSDDYNNSFLTFSSLNGYQKDGKKGDYDYSEFVQPQSASQGTTAQTTIIKKGTVKVESPGKHMPAQYDNVYFGADDFPSSKDQLGVPGYSEASVSFMLSGEHNKFLIGTGAGEGAANWFTFSSAAVAPIKQSNPSKTVEPLKQYKSGDTWDNPTGESVGFNQRYYNDLDRYNDGQGGWDLPNDDRVTGHDADNPDSLLSGIPHKADRFVKDGQSYYYFINQKTINPVSQGQNLPTGYSIADSLPDGVTLADSKDPSEDFTLYNLDGKEITDFFTKDSTIQNDKFDVKFTDLTTDKINQLDQSEDYFGQDFSLRVKVTVHNSSSDSVNDLMTNQANTTFNYTDDMHFSTDTNKVQTRIKDKINKITFVKENSQNEPLKNAHFELYHADENSKPTGTLLDKFITDNNGQFVLTSMNNMTPGKYILVETQAPGGYSKHDFTFDLDSNGAISNLSKNGDGAYRLVDKKIPMSIDILKTDGVTGQALSGAEYSLYVDSNNSKKLVDTETSNSDGKIIWKDLDTSNTYYVKETKAPKGYELSRDEYKIVFDADSNTWKVLLNDEVIKDGKGSNDDIHVQYLVKDRPEFALPSTGGIGTLIFSLLGLLLISVSTILLRKRGVINYGRK